MAEQQIIAIKPLPPENLDAEALMRPLRVAFKAQAKAIVREFGKGTSTWTHRPTWNIKYIGFTGRAIWKAIISTSDTPFVWVEMGTKVRKRTLSRDWISKTQPRKLASGSGQGRATGFTKRHHMPGIKARDFRVIIAKQQQVTFEARMRATMIRSSKHMFSGRAPGSTTKRI